MLAIVKMKICIKWHINGTSSFSNIKIHLLIPINWKEPIDIN
jgi:hypothetical protein